MTCQLILMRHAKSDHDDPSVSDHDRPLASRGIRDTPRIADWIADQDCVPQLILSSSSVRTQQTAELLLDRWDENPAVSYSESLYLSNPETILAAIRGDNRGLDCVMVLAHNPGMSMLASILSNRAVEMPTAAVAIFEVKGPRIVADSRNTAAASVSHPLDCLGTQGATNQCVCTLTHFASPKTISP